MTGLKKFSPILVVMLLSACASGKLSNVRTDNEPEHIKTCCTDPNHHFPDNAAKVTADSTIYFDYDKYSVSEKDTPVVRKFAEYMQLNPDWQVRIEGHTDNRGGREYNLALGLKRADAIAKMLLLLGVAPGRISVTSFGQEYPKVDEENDAAWAKNRRVEFKISP